MTLFSSIIALELVALNSLFTEKESYSFRVNVLTNGLNILHTTKTETFELKFSQSDQKIRKYYCRASFSSV